MQGGTALCRSSHRVALRLDDPVVPSDLPEVPRRTHRQHILDLPWQSMPRQPEAGCLPPFLTRAVTKGLCAAPARISWAPGHLSFGGQLQGQVLAISSLSFRPQEKLVPALCVYLQQVLSGSEVGVTWAELKDPHLQRAGGVGGSCTKNMRLACWTSKPPAELSEEKWKSRRVWVVLQSLWTQEAPVTVVF